jgi:hypothetical protein
MNPKPLVLPVLAAALAVTVQAQEVRCLLDEGAPVPGLAGHTVSSISNTAVNQLGGYACSINTTDGLTTRSVVWGAATFGAAGAPLQVEGTLGIYEQTAFESFFGIDDAGTVSYGPTCTDTVSGTTGLDSVFFGATPVAVEGEPIPTLPGKVYRFNSRPGATAAGVPFWVGGINDGTSGANEGEALFYGLGATPLYKTGDLLAGAPAAIDGIDFDTAFSALGTHHLAGVLLALSTAEDFLVVMDGAPLSLGGALAQEDQPVPAAIGGLPSEVWGSFDSFGVNEAGDFMITGNTDGGATATNEFVIKNGVILHREGDVLDGRVLTGAMEGAAMNANGEIAFVWDVEDPGGDLEALYFDGALLLLEGDPVDMTGDGVPDPGATVANFTGIAAVTLGAERAVYFTADVDFLGTTSSTDDVECFFAARAPKPDLLASPGALSSATGGTQALFLDAGAAHADEIYLVAGSVTGSSPGFPFGGFTVPLNPDFYFFITLNSPNHPPLVDTLGTLSAEGTALARWELPAGFVPSLAGITMTHAYVLLDPLSFLPTFVSSTTDLAIVP